MTIHTLSDLKDYPQVASALGEMIISWARMDVALIGALTRISGASLNHAREIIGCTAIGAPTQWQNFQ
jgi:hypothetical protein